MANPFDEIDPPAQTKAAAAPAPKNPFDEIDPPQGGGGGQSTTGEMSWSDVPAKALENAPSSALEFGKSLVQPILHPVDTAKSLGNVALGTVEKIIPGGEYPHEKYANAVGRYFLDRYGSEEGWKKAIAEDPVGVLSDMSMAIGGVGGLTAKAGQVAKLEKLGRVGETVGNVGRAIDPVMAPIGAAKAGAELVGGLGTHTGSGPLREAYRAGVEGGEKGKVFREEMRGAADMSDVVDTARQGLTGLYRDKADQYMRDMAPVNADYHMLDFTGIDNALANVSSVKKFKGVDINRKTADIRGEINALIDEWRGYAPAQYHTPAGFDALKQSIGDIMDHTAPGTPARRVAREAYNAVKSEIVKQAPEYAKAMKNYESAMDMIREMEQSLSLKQGANIDTTLRKLQSIMRNNVNANYGRRMELGEMLEQAGAKHLMSRLAGQTLNTWTPRGLGKAAAEIGLLGAGAHAAAFPWAAAALPAMSPRLMGETAHLAGRAAAIPRNVASKIIGDRAARNLTSAVGSRATGDIAHEIGRTPEMKPPKDDEEAKKKLPRVYINTAEFGRSNGGPVRRYADGGPVRRAVQSLKDFAEGGAPEEDAPFGSAGVGARDVDWSQLNKPFGQIKGTAPEDTPVAFKHPTNPLLNITEGDIDRGMNVGLGAATVTPAVKGASAIRSAVTEAAPVWRSAVEDAIETLPMKSAPADQWANTLRNAKGIKPEEMDWLGLQDFFAAKKAAGEKVTKQELLDHVAGNKVELQDVVKADKRTSATGETIFEAQERAAKEQFGRSYVSLNPEERGAVDEALKSIAPTKYHSYQLPGGENYREHLLTMPTKKVNPSPDEINNLARTLYETYERRGGEPPWERIAPDVQQIYRERAQEKSYLAENPNMYRSPHWDEPNVLAHVRTNDRMMGDKRSLHLEEVQSDWHQKGRKEGYALSPQERARVDEIIAQGDKVGGVQNLPQAIQDEAKVLGERLTNRAVPSAPFKDTDAWAGLAMKRMIRHAAVKGYDRISWTPGEAQAARYDLSKSIEKLSYNPKQSYLKAWDKNGNEVIAKEGIKPEQLPDLIGKEAAERVMAQQPKDFDRLPSVNKEDLKVTQDEHQYIVTNKDKRGVKIGKGTVGSEDEALDYAHRYLNKTADEVNKNREREYGRLGPTHILEGQDLKVGGEGMREFYDKMLPKIAEKIGKAHGVKVQRGEVSTGLPKGNGTNQYGAMREGDNYYVVDRDHNRIGPAYPTRQEAINAMTMMMKGGGEKGLPVHYFDIPPSLREQAMKGMSMFKKGGRVTLGKPRSRTTALNIAYQTKRER